MDKLLNTIESYRAKPYRMPILMLSLLLAVSLGFIDYYAGHELVFAVFYLIIISLVIILSNIRAGVIVSFISFLTCLAVDLSYKEKYSSIVFPLLNNAFRLIYFLMHTFLLSALIDFYQRTKRLSLIDPLTNINNVRSFMVQFQREIHKSRRSMQPISLIYFDIDNFKFVNDSLGHLAGDTLLKTLANTISRMLRPMDVFARLGGDEFALLLPETDLNNSKAVVKRIQTEVMRTAAEHGWPISLSMGLASFTSFDLSLDEMIKMADELMYQVKKDGKNSIRYMLYPEG